MKVISIVDVPAQIAQAAMVSRALRARSREAPFEEVIVHTGPAETVDHDLLRQLEAPEPAHTLGIHPGDDASTLALMLERLDEVLRRERPHAVVVYADTTATLAGALAASRLGLPLAHVEAGERLFRRRHVPEEVNRVLTDHASWLCLTSTRRSALYLRREGMAPQRVRYVGDPTYDLYRFAHAGLEKRAATRLEALGVVEGEFCLATLHSSRNLEDPERLRDLLTALDRSPRPVLLPRTSALDRALGALQWMPSGSLRVIPPLEPFDFLAVLSHCRVVVSDSGRVAREAFFALRPCIVPLEHGWWPEIAEAGWAVETGHDHEALLTAIGSYEPPNEAPEGLFGDGESADQIVSEIAALLQRSAGGDGPWHLHGAFEDLPRAEASSFTYQNYRHLLRRFQEEGYAFLTFDQALDPDGARGPFVLLRHDIDLDLAKAVRMAEVEAELGVRSTYFVMLRTDHYNILSPEQSQLVVMLRSLGHEIGLHFDCAAYPELTTPAEIATACQAEVSLLERWFHTRVGVVSFHRPTALVLTGDPALSAPLPHTYMPRFVRDIHYCSDSRGRWASGSPLSCAAFSSRLPMHVLIHPVWWAERPISPYETLLAYVDRRHRALEISVARNSTPYRIGWLNHEVAVP